MTRRRSLLQKGGGSGAGAGLLTDSAAADSDTPRSGESDEILGDGTLKWSQTGDYREWRAPDIYYDHHLGLSIEQFEQDPGGSHEFRVAGDFCMVMQDGTLPPETPASVLSQGMRIENESPGGLSVFTSSNSSEIAMNPQPASGYGGGSFASAFSLTTGAISLAATIAGSATCGLALGAVSVVSGMYALHDNGDTSTSGISEWSGPTPGDDRRGGHHADFGVNEHGGGSIKVASKIGNVTNEWRLTFDNGVTDVSQI